MAIKKINLTDDHLKLISHIKFEQFSFGNEAAIKRYGWGIDQWGLFGGTYVMEDVARIIGKFDQYIKGTEENANGRQFPPELEDYMWSLYMDIVADMELIMDLVLYYSNKGGLSVGTYKCNTNTMVWEKMN